MLSPLLRHSLQQRHILLSLKHLIRQWNRPCYSRSSDCSVPLMATGEESGLPLNEVVSKLTNFALPKLAESWDNVGLLVEPTTKKNVTKILLTNDLTENVMDEALEVEADLIISYHPPIFSPLKSVTRRTWKERIIANCLENRIAVYSPHTSFDAVAGGVNDWLASAFVTKSVKPITQNYAADIRSKPFKVEIISPLTDATRATIVLQMIQTKLADISREDIIGKISIVDDEVKLTVSCSKDSLAEVTEIFHTYVKEGDKELFKISKYEDVPLPGVGMGRLCYLETPLKVITVVELIKKLTRLQHVRLALARHRNMTSQVSTIAMCAGSGSSVLRNVKADLYLTGEMGHHDVLDAVHKGIHVILCDHSNTERGFLRVFSEKLSSEILGDKVVVEVSKADHDPLQIL